MGEDGGHSVEALRGEEEIGAVFTGTIYTLGRWKSEIVVGHVTVQFMEGATTRIERGTFQQYLNETQEDEIL